MNFKHCVRCKEKFFAMSNCQLYCAECRKIVNQISLRERSNKFRKGNMELCRKRVKAAHEKYKEKYKQNRLNKDFNNEFD
jgi:hypothetical protein